MASSSSAAAQLLVRRRLIAPPSNCRGSLSSTASTASDAFAPARRRAEIFDIGQPRRSVSCVVALSSSSGNRERRLRRFQSEGRGCFQHPRHPHRQILQQRRDLAVYAYGQSWTGALGLGPDAVINAEEYEARAADEMLDEVPLTLPPNASGGANDKSSLKVHAVKAGWGHTALLVSDGEKGKGRLLISGRPQDFQSLLRLKRMPSFMRRFVVRQSLNHALTPCERGDDATPSSGSPLNAIARLMLGDEEINLHDEDRRLYGLLPYFTEIHLPDGDTPALPSAATTSPLDASAGLTGIIGSNGGTVYTMGLNHRGQCGVGYTSSNVWHPTPVKGLSTEFAHEGRFKLQQERPVVQLALGLQHGVALDEVGNVYAWGKGERGQLGQGPGSTLENQTTDFALRVTEFLAPGYDQRVGLDDEYLSEEDSRVVRISAGMNHSAAITESNLAYVWGKNVAPPEYYEEDGEGGDGGGGSGFRSAVIPRREKAVWDAPAPYPLSGLPPNLQIIDVTCGSHHSAFLLEDGSVYAVGVATDDASPIVGTAVEIIPPGAIEMPPRQFEAHFGTTTIVGRDGRQVLEVQLWSHEELRRDAAVVPGWLERLEERTGEYQPVRVRCVSRGWMHTVIVTDDDDEGSQNIDYSTSSR